MPLRSSKLIQELENGNIEKILLNSDRSVINRSQFLLTAESVLLQKIKLKKLLTNSNNYELVFISEDLALKGGI